MSYQSNVTPVASEQGKREYSDQIESGSEEGSRQGSPVPFMVTVRKPVSGDLSSSHKRSSSQGSVETIIKVSGDIPKVFTSPKQIAITAVQCQELIDLINIAVAKTQVIYPFKTQIVNDVHTKLKEKTVNKIHSSASLVIDSVKSHINILIGTLFYQQWIQCEINNNQQYMSEALEDCHKLLKQRISPNINAGDATIYKDILEQPEIQQALSTLMALASMDKRLALVKKQSDTLNNSADEQYQSLTNVIKNSTYEEIQTQFDTIDLSSLPKLKTQDAGSRKNMLLAPLLDAIKNMYNQIDNLLKSHKDNYSNTAESIWSLRSIHHEFYADTKLIEKLNAHREACASVAVLHELIKVERGLVATLPPEQRKAIGDIHLEKIKNLQEEINKIDELNNSISNRISFMNDAKEDLSLIQDTAATKINEFKQQFQATTTSNE